MAVRRRFRPQVPKSQQSRLVPEGTKRQSRGRPRRSLPWPGASAFRDLAGQDPDRHQGRQDPRDLDGGKRCSSGLSTMRCDPNAWRCARWSSGSSCARPGLLSTAPPLRRNPPAKNRRIRTMLMRLSCFLRDRCPIGTGRISISSGRSSFSSHGRFISASPRPDRPRSRRSDAARATRRLCSGRAAGANNSNE